MRVAVLPFNAADDVKPAYGRQFAAFVAEQLRVRAEADVNVVSLLTQMPDEQGVNRVVYVNLGGEFLAYEQLKDLFQQDVNLVMDGLLKEEEGKFALTVRFHGPDSEQPVAEDTLTYPREEVFALLDALVKKLAEQMQIGLPELMAGETIQFGTQNPEAFLSFLEGYDSFGYIQQANGAVSPDFNPKDPIDDLMKAIEMDPEFEAPYHVAVQICRLCMNFRLGNVELIDGALTKLAEVKPNLFPAYLAHGELFSMGGDHSKAADFIERAIQREPNDAGLYTRLGLEQVQSGMPVNAERNFRKAVEMGGEDKSALVHLEQVLVQTGRAHEAPALWKAELDKDPQNGFLASRHAMALINSGKVEEGEKAFEAGLEDLEDSTVLKRFYAPYLAQKGDIDRALDFYEDCMDVAPNDVPLLWEYVQVLKAAGREVDMPDTLNQILQNNQDPNLRAEAQAMLIEIEQPKRVESVERAREKMEKGDFETAARELKPLRNWLADYWKLWALLASAYNRLEQWQEAMEAADHLVRMYPGCEPAYGELATALNGQERHEEAYNVMRMAVEQAGLQSLPIYVNLALAAKRAGREDEARNLARQIREAVGPNPELDPVLTEIER